MRITVAFLGIVLAYSVSWAQQAEKPQFKVGDYWIFQRTESVPDRMNPAPPTWERRILQMNADGTMDVQEEGVMKKFDSAFNLLSEHGPEYSRIENIFPFVVGAPGWTGSRKVDPNLSDIEEYSRFKVADYGPLKVPAGTFDCFHIVGDRRVDKKSVGAWIPIEKWYCPKVNNIAKLIFEANIRRSYGPGSRNVITSELIDSSYLH